MKAELEKKDYFTVLTEDETLSSMFTKEELKQLIDPASYTACAVFWLWKWQIKLKRQLQS